MVNFLERSKIHQTFRQAKKIRQHRRQLMGQGVERCHVVSAYPKSGNTWLARMLAHAICCEVVAYISDAKERVPRESSLHAEELRHDVVIARSHHMASLLMLGGFASNDIVSVVRDPRDIAVSGSGFFFSANNVPNENLIDQMIDQMVRTEKPCVRWQDVRWDTFVRSSIEKNVILVRYVDLLQDTKGVLKRILTRLGYDRSDEQIDEVVSYHSFASSKSRAAASGQNDVFQYLRSGEAGAYRTHLLPRQQQRIESEFGQTMRELGYL